MDNEKKYSTYKLIDIILGLLSLVLLFITIPINKTNPFGFVSSIKDSPLISIILVLIVLIYLVLLFIVLCTYLVFYIKKINLDIFLNDFINKSYVIPLFISILLILSSFISINTVDGTSMEENFYDGDKVLVLKTNDIENDDVIIIDIETKYLIKRVIASKGDTITITSTGYLTVNNNEPFYTGHGSSLVLTNYTLKDGEYFCLGDNRSISLDSRHYGIFNDEQVFGRVIYKFKSWKK